MVVSGMSSGGALALAGVAGAFAAIGLYGFLTRLRRDRAVADTPLVRVRSAAQGYVKIMGHARTTSGTPTPAPLSGRPCVWWKYSIARQCGTDEKGHPQYTTVESETSVDPFLLEQDDAQCLVGPVHAEVTPSVFNVWSGATRRPTAGPGAATHGNDYQYSEGILEADGKVCVVGEFRSHSETGGDVSAAAARECDAQSLSADIARVSVISRPADGRPFLIAALTPEMVERRERFHAWGYLAWGFAWILVCVWALLLSMSARP